MCTIGYLPYAPTAHSVEAGWLADHLGQPVRVLGGPSLYPTSGLPLPSRPSLDGALTAAMGMTSMVAEGPGGFLWAALLRALGYSGSVTVLPYLNPRQWYDVAAIALYRLVADPTDRVFLGSTPSAAVYRALGVDARVGEPFGVDDRHFCLRPDAAKVRAQLAIPPGRMLLFAGRAQPDKDLYRLLRAALKARLLFPDLQVVVATHVADAAYLAPLHAAEGVQVVVDPSREQLADLYNVADVFVTASTSHFETFGRAPAEALCCGTTAIAPRYDGFVEVLDQPGGRLVDLEVDPATGAPQVDEAMLLRTVYDVLSDPRPPHPRLVSDAARRRFGRSHTVRLLDRLHGGTMACQEAPIVPSPAPIDLPGPWQLPLAEIASRCPGEAIEFFWNRCDHRRLGEADGEFVARVRRALCVPSPADNDEGRLACR